MSDLPGLKFHTRRNPERTTRGTIQAAFAKHVLRQELMPWQRRVLDVAGELEHDPETGLMLPVYSKVVVTVQRQAGKSHVALARQAQRCTFEPGTRAWYTAQTGLDARKQWLKFAEHLEKTSLASKIRVLRGAGTQAMVKWTANGSELHPYPPKVDALHGEQADDVDIDEAWAFDLEHGRALTQAGAPTKLTRPGAQTWIWSAGGTAASTWLAELVAQGRAGATDQDYGTGRLCYFELGIPDDADAEDLDVIAEHHPAVGHTITRRSLEEMREEFVGDPAGWARAAGNRWTEVIGGGVDASTWESVRHPDAIPAGVPVGYGAARSPAGDQVVIAVAAQVEPDLVVVEVLEVLPTSWQAGGHIDAWTRNGPVAVWPNGPSRNLHRDLVDLKREPVPMTQADAVAATSTILDALPHRGVRFRKHPALDAAVPAAGLRTVDGGGKVWAPTTETPIAALEAGTAAIAALRPANQPPAPLPAPYVVFA